MDDIYDLILKINNEFDELEEKLNKNILNTKNSELIKNYYDFKSYIKEHYHLIIK